MARIRNTKKLGQRVDRTYLKRLFPIPRWRRLLTAGFIAAGLAWLIAYAVARNQTIYSSGPLTPAHAFLGKNCATCHRAEIGIGKRVADTECKTCHDGPLHNAEQISNPSCVACHVEHRGELRLVDTTDEGCRACHSNLHTKSGKATIEASIPSFNQHPEFALARAGVSSVGLKFNHAKHVGELSQKCGDCHTPADTKVPPHSQVSSHALMNIPTYAGTCLPCHALTVDDKVSDPAPHDKPEVVHKFVVEQLTKVGLASKVAEDEKKLWDETCARCHTMETAAGQALPTVKPTAIPQRWLAKASFDHTAHQAVACASCHPKAAASTSASDLLLPGIATCQQCHAAGHTSAGSNCSVCHMYHDWSKEKPVEGKFKMTFLTHPVVPGRRG